MDNKPDFLIIGAAKCGTTSLARNLNAYPQIHLLPGEMHYFSRRFERGDHWYLSHFKAAGKIQGEKSPTYLYDTSCHEHMHGLLPGAKLIILLRDPAARAFSNWNMRYNDNRLIQQGLTFNRNYGNALKSLNFDKLFDYYLENFGNQLVWEMPLDIFHRGLYIQQIENLLKFYPKEQVLILITERFFKAQQNGYNEVCRFLEAAPFDLEGFEKEHIGYYRKKMPKAVEEKLREFYRPYNLLLFELLGGSVEEWQ